MMGQTESTDQTKPNKHPISRVVLWAGMVLIALLIGAAVLSMVALRKNEIADWKRHMSSLSLVLAEQTKQSMYLAQDALDEVAEHMRAYKGLGQAGFRAQASSIKTHQFLKKFVTQGSHLDVVTIVAANGEAINFSRHHPVNSLSLADRDYFRWHQENATGGDYLSEPVRNKSNGKWTFYLTRRINDEKGHLVAVILAGISVEKISQFYEKIIRDMGPGSSVSLFRSNLQLLARWPHRDEMMGQINRTGTAYKIVKEQGLSEGTILTNSPRFSNGQPDQRLGASRAVPDYPLYVQLVVTEDMYLAVWRRSAVFVGLVTAASAMVLGFALLGLVRLLAQREADLTKMQELQNQAVQASLSKSQFLATMSHEIRTPMNGILGMAQVMQMPGVSEQERLGYAQTLLKSGETMMQLLNDILDFSKVEAGKMQLHLQGCDPSGIAQDVAKLFTAPAHKKGLKVAVLAEPGSFYVCDPLRLRQMLSNLVSNAIKFTTEGQIEIRLMELARRGDNAVLEFSVSDTGVGLTSDQQSKLFQPFSQIESDARSRFLGGTGLGLSTVKAMAQLMGGEVGVSSQLGKGSRFWFTIEAEPTSQYDLQSPGAGRSSVTTAKAPEHVGRARILVAEDNSTNMVVIRAVLEKMGHEVHGVSNGQQAVDALVGGLACDLVLMDVQMPVMDGLQATRAIREWEAMQQRKHLPILALTATAREEDRLACQQAGMDDVLLKPVDVATVRLLLAAHLKP